MPQKTPKENDVGVFSEFLKCRKLKKEAMAKVISMEFQKCTKNLKKENNGISRISEALKKTMKGSNAGVFSEFEKHLEKVKENQCRGISGISKKMEKLNENQGWGILGNQRKIKAGVLSEFPKKRKS